MHAESEGYAVELTTFIDEAQQHRSLRANECTVLAEAVAVVVAVALDPVAVAEVDRVQVTGPSVPAAPPTPSSVATKDTAPLAVRRPSIVRGR